MVSSKFRLIFCVTTSCKTIYLQGVYVSICAMLTTNHRAVGVNMYRIFSEYRPIDQYAKNFGDIHSNNPCAPAAF